MTKKKQLPFDLDFALKNPDTVYTLDGEKPLHLHYFGGFNNEYPLVALFVTSGNAAYCRLYKKDGRYSPPLSNLKDLIILVDDVMEVPPAIDGFKWIHSVRKERR